MAQIEKLKNFAGESGYYCFYDMNKDERNSPLIQKANAIVSIIEKNDERTLSFGTKSLQRNDVTDRHDGGIPLSVFLTFEMLNSDNENIKSFANLWQAKRFIEGQNENSLKNRSNKISKVLTISIGGVSNSNQDLRDISQLFKFEDYTD